MTNDVKVAIIMATGIVLATCIYSEEAARRSKYEASVRCVEVGGNWTHWWGGSCKK